MTDAEQKHIEDACRALSLAYGRHIDFGNYDAFADLFAVDGILEVGRPSVGRETDRNDVRSTRSPSLRSRHVLTNIFIDVLDADHATRISYLTLFRFVCEGEQPIGPLPLDEPSGVGHYADRFVRTEGGWRFAHRKLEFAFRAGAEAPASGGQETVTSI